MKSLNEQFGEALFMTTHAWRTELDRRLRPLGFSHSRWLLLLHLSRHDGCTQNELAFHMGIEAPTLVRLVDHMEREGLLTRRVSATDRRAKNLFLSESGIQVVEEIRTYANDLRKEIFSDLSQSEIKASIEVINKIRNKLGTLS